MSVCLCVGNAFSHFSDFDDATALLRYPPTRMHPPTASTPFFVFFSIVHQYSNWRFSVCLSVCVCVCWLRFFEFFGFRRYINTLIGGFPCVCLSVCVWVTLFGIFGIHMSMYVDSTCMVIIQRTSHSLIAALISNDTSIL